MTRIIKLIILVVMVIGIGYFVLTCWGNCAVFPGERSSPPSVPDADYTNEIEIVNTGRVIYTDDVVKDGSVYVVNGYWEFDGGKWVYRNQTLRLDEELFGTIVVR